MSTEFIERFADKRRTLFSAKENKIDTIAKISHLFINGKRISAIGDLRPCKKNLRVIYLHNNAIRTITNLQNLNALTHLYLQNNRIEEIDNLNELPNLTKLYLGSNEIKTLNNLDGLPRLKELHIERQRLEPNDVFTFDRACMEDLSSHLEVINIAGLKLTTLHEISNLHQLKHLLASDNKFMCPIELGKSLEPLLNLRCADLQGCPAQKHTYYREHILETAHQIDTLDGNAIPRSTRNFIRNFAKFKTKRCNDIIMANRSALSRQNTGISVNEPTEEMGYSFSTINEVSFDAPKTTFKLNRNVRRLPASAFTIGSKASAIPKQRYTRNYSSVSDNICRKIAIVNKI